MTPARLEVALETSSRHPSVAARLGGRLVERSLTAERAHASDLLPSLAELLEELGRAPGTLDAIFVGSGPGSYTGLRVGMATALGLARASGAELFALPSLEVLAWQCLAAGESAAFVLDARQDEFYLARYARDAGGLRVLRAPCVVASSELPSELQEGEALFADEATLRTGWAAPSSARTAPTPRAASLLELAALRLASEGSQSAADIAPLYLRAFHAKPRRR